MKTLHSYHNYSYRNFLVIRILMPYPAIILIPRALCIVQHCDSIFLGNFPLEANGRAPRLDLCFALLTNNLVIDAQVHE